MAETKTEKIEREYTIPLRREWDKVPRYKRANKAVKTIKEFLARHMKIYDRDLRKIKIDRYLNEEVWFRGIKKPPARIKVLVKRDGDIVRVELADYKDNLKFKKAREEKMEKKAEEVKTKHAHIQGESHEGHGHDVPEKETEEEKKEAEEKKASTIEGMEKLEKQEHRKMKRQTKQKNEPKHQFRKALQK
jgi:large subunit ribosomal protein L31e